MADGTLVELETWPQLPNYMEIEGKSSEAVQKTAELLGLDWNEHIVQSNDHLYVRHLGIDRKAVLERLANLTFSVCSAAVAGYFNSGFKFFRRALLYLLHYSPEIAMCVS